MKKLILFLIGVVPLPLGYLMNHLLMTVYFDKVLPYALIGIVFLGVWFFLGFLTYDFTKSDKEALIITHSFAFLCLVLILFQEIIMRRYWSNYLGMVTQFFYLPLVNIASKFTFFSSRLYWVYIVAFLFLCVSFYYGRRTRRRSRMVKYFNH